jgi:hypothetical protein
MTEPDKGRPDVGQAGGLRAYGEKLAELGVLPLLLGLPSVPTSKQRTSNVPAIRPLERAVMDASLDDVRRLLAEGHDPNQDCGGRWTLLMLAVDHLRPDIVEALLEAGADPNLGDSQGLTPMHIAADMACMMAQNSSPYELDWTCFHLLERFGGRRDMGSTQGTPADTAAAWGRELPAR